jgi:hypothetical protein
MRGWVPLKLSRLLRPFVIVGAVVGILVGAAPALGSYGLATNATRPSLRVDSKGDAEVTWTQGGQTTSFIVPPSGQGYHGAVAVDVSKPSSLALPLAVSVRQTSGGTYYALQQFAVTGQPTSLEFSRWTGAPTQVTLTLDGPRLTGTVTYHGKPVTGSRETPGGRPVRIYVELECFGCSADRTGWSYMLGVPPKADGSFAVYLRSSWEGKRYRATVPGPNAGGDYAPVARTEVAAP